MKNFRLGWFLAVLTFMAAAKDMSAQTWRHTNSTALELSGSGSDITHTITLKAPPLTGSTILTFPASNAVGLLTNDGAGALSWGLLGTSSIVPGGSNTILVTNGLGSVGWAGFSSDATLTGNGIGSMLGIDLTHANTWTGTQTVNKANIQSTFTDGVVLSNTTASDATHGIQQSPNLTFKSNVWSTTGGSNTTFDGRLTFLDSTGGSPSGRFSFATNNNGAGYIEQMMLTSEGVLSTGSLTLATALTEANGGTNQTTYENGDMLYASNVNTLNRLPIALLNGQVLTASSGFPAWTALDLSNPNAIVNSLPVLNGGTGVNAGSAGNGKLLIGNGAGFTLANLVAGPTGPIGITNGAGTLTLNLPQNLTSASSPTFAGMTLNGDVGFGGNSNRSILVLQQGVSNSPGSNLTVQAGQAGATADQNGGTLTLASGAARGNGSSSINFETVKSGQGSSSTTRNPATIATLDGSGTLAFAAGAPRQVSISAAQAGHNGDTLQLNSGSGTTSAGSNQNGGDVVITSGAKANAGNNGSIVMNIGGAEQARFADAGTTLNSSLTVNGYLSLPEAFTALPGSATSDNVDPGNRTVLGVSQYGTAGPFTITGFTGGTDGRELIVANMTTYELTLGSARGSAVVNQIITSNGLDLVMPPYSIVQLLWSNFANGWFVEFTSGINDVELGTTGLTTVTPNGIVFGNGSNPLGVTSAAANSILVTDASNIPSLSQTLPSAVQANITSLTGMSGAITYPTSLTFDGTAARTMTLGRNTSSVAGQGLTIQAGAPAASSSTNNLSGGDLTISSGISEGTGLSSIFFKTPAISGIGNVDNTPSTRLTINSTQINLAAGIDLLLNGTQRISSSGAGNLASLTLGTPLLAASGGTGNAYTTFTTGGSTARTFTLPNADATLLSTTTGVKLQSTTPGTAQNGNANLAGVFLADSIGIGTSSPKAGLDIEGTLVYGLDSITVVGSSTNNNVSPGTKVDVSVGLSGTPGPTTITGFSGGVPGRFIKVGNITGQPITLAHMSGSSSAGNRIFTPTQTDLTLPMLSFAALSYIPELGAWTVEYTGGMPAQIALGGTGATTAAGALANLLPASPTSGYFLEWNGSAFVWNSASASPGVVTSVGVSGGSTGLTTSGGPITSAGTITLGGTLAIANGGTGQTTKAASFNALVPDSIGNAGKVLYIQPGGGYIWSASAAGSGSVTSISGSGGSTGLTLTGGPITTSGSLTLGGTLATANGGTGIDAGGVTDGQLLIGQTSGHSLGLGTIGAGTNLVVTNGGHSLSIATVANPVFSTSTTTPTVFGGNAAGSVLNLQSTSSGSPTGDYITFTSGGTEKMRLTSSGKLGLGTTPLTTLDVNGKVSIQKDTVTITGGTSNNDVSSGSTSRLSIGLAGLAAASTITGFTGGTKGSELRIKNYTGQTLTLANANSGSLAGNRINTQIGGDILLPNGQTASFVWNVNYGMWDMDAVGGVQPVGAGGTGSTSLTQNGILFGNGTSPIGVTSAAANSVLITNGSNVPSLSTTLPSAVQANITALTGMTGAITGPTSLTYDGTALRTMTLSRNTGTIAGQGLTLQAGAPAASAASSNLAGGDLTLSSGVSEGTGLSSIFFKTAAAGTTGNTDNAPATRATLDASNLNLGSGIGLETNGTTRISSAGVGTLASLTLTSALPATSGGTGQATFAIGDILYASSTTALSRLPIGTSSQILHGGTTPTFSTLTSADLPGSFSGFANPTASAGLTAVNGSASTAMRSDGAPAIDQTISPTWTGTHTHQKNGIATTFTNAELLANTTAATSLVPVQQSPSLLFRSHVWNTTATAADSTVDARVTLIPVSGPASTTTTNAALQVAFGNTSGGSIKNLTISSRKISTSDSDFALEQTGDVYGTTRLHIQNRNGSNCALFEQAGQTGIDLADFGFKPNAGAQSNLRLEARPGTIRNTANNAIGEFEFFMNSTSTTSSVYNFSTGEGATTIELGNVGIGLVNPTQKLQVHNGDVLLSNNSGNADTLSFQGTSTGITGFRAGAQGAANILYTLPVTAPTTDRSVLQSTAAGTMSWATPPGIVQTASASALSPTGSSTTEKMMGMGSSFTYTPTVSPNVLIMMTGTLTNNTGDDGTTVQMRWGTGTAPSNQATLVGTAVGAKLTAQATTSGSGGTIPKMPFCCTAVLTGLTLNTAIWIDASVAAITGGTGSISGVTISVVGLP